MGASERDLVAPEGVDEGSAASTTEDERTGSDGDVVGTLGHGEPVNPEQDAAPVDAETEDTRVPQPGQQYQVGEG